MTERVLNLGKLIGTLDPLSSDFDAARREIERLDDAELAARVAGLAEIDQTTDYEIVFDRKSAIDEMLVLRPPRGDFERARANLERLPNDQIFSLHSRLKEAHAHATALLADRKSRSTMKVGPDGSDDIVSFVSEPEELHY